MRKMSQVVAVWFAVFVGAFAPVVFADESSSVESVVLAAVNINTATVKELSAGLNGVGDKKAQAIIEYREQYGPFKTVGEITDVKGIGKGILQKNSDRIVLE